MMVKPSTTARLPLYLLVFATILWCGTISAQTTIGGGGDEGDDTSSASIVGGTPVTKGAVPGFVHRAGYPPCYDDFSSEALIICGGHLVHPRFVLTAAHCRPLWQIFNVDYLMAFVGGTDVLGRDAVEKRGLAQLIAHPNFSYAGGPGSTHQNDLMLVQLLTPSTQPVGTWATANPINPLDDGQPNVGDRVQMVGFGATTGGGYESFSLQTVATDVVDDGLCNFTGYDATTMFCAGTNTTTSCKGDDGGPIFNASNEIVGIVSTVLCDGPGAHVRVAAYADWICDTICSVDGSAPCCTPLNNQPAPQTITATVRTDANGNGVADDTDPAVEGVACRLRTADRFVVAVATTDAAGVCGFANVPDFPLTLSFDRPAGMLGEPFLIPAFGSVQLTGYDEGQSTVNYAALLRDEQDERDEPVCEGFFRCFVYYVLFGWLLDFWGFW